MELGKKLRLLRGNMTQVELAGRSGVDKAIISKIESGKMDGTVECHQKLAEVFDLKLSEFYAFIEEKKSQPAELRSGNNKTDVYQNFLEILTSVPLAKKMLPSFISLQPQEEKFLEETLKNVERFIIVLEGEVAVDVEGTAYHLKKFPEYEKGDSLYSLSPKRHSLKNTGPAISKILCVSCPPVL